MDKKTLKQYIPLQKEIQMLDKRIDRLYEKLEDVPTVMGKVTKSSKDFPYIEEHMSVQMAEPKEASEIKKLLRIRENRRKQAMKTAEGIEEFISEIPDSTNRQIFELTFLEGKKQREVAETVNLDRSVVSRRISSYLEFAHKTQK